MSKHVPPSEDFVPWVGRLSFWWQNRKIVNQMRQEMHKTNCWQEARHFYKDQG